LEWWSRWRGGESDDDNDGG